jgi:hemolysin activation/secretion protein
MRNLKRYNSLNNMEKRNRKMVFGVDVHNARLVAFAIIASCSSFAFSQNLPPAAQPGAAEKQLQRPSDPTAPTHRAPMLTSPVQVAPPGSESVTFVLQSLDVDGAKSVTTSELTAPYKSLIGKQISLAKLYGIANAMTATYRSRGYLLSAVIVPAQTVNQGDVRLQAVEGYLEDVKFEGYLGNRSGMFAAMRTRLLADRPLRAKVLERALLLLNDLDGIHAQGILQPSATPSAADLIVRIARTAVSMSAGANNRGSTFEGPNQKEASISVNSLLGAFESTSLQYLGASKSSELQLFALSHRERLTADGLDLTVSASHSKAEPKLTAAFSDFELDTTTTQARIQLDFPFQRTREDTVAARLALTYHDGTTDAFSSPLTKDKIAAVRAGFRWDHLDSWAGVNLVDTEIGKGIHALGASSDGSLLASRIGGRPDFGKATLYVARLQSVGAGFSVLVAGSGQYAFDRLLEPEEFAFGGEPFGRAYQPSELVGDSGLAAKAELRWTADLQYGISTTLYVFGDRGEVWRRLLPEEAGLRRTDAASSRGGGLRCSLGPWATAYVEVAKPTDHVISALGNRDTHVFGGFEVRYGL